MKHQLIFNFMILLWVSFFSTVHSEWLVINTIPADAEVVVNDKVAGRTPLRVEGTSGEAKVLSVTAEFYDTFVIEYDFVENKSIYIDLETGSEIDEDTYWRKKTAEIETTPEPVVPVEENTPEPVPTEADTIRPAPVLPKMVPELQSVPDPDPLPDSLKLGVAPGEVIFDLKIRNNGSVTDIGQVVGPENAELRTYLEEWVGKWTFKPASDGGNPVDGDIKIKIVFDPGKGEFSLPTYDIVRRTTEIDTVPTEEPTAIVQAVPADDTIYFEPAEVQQKATVFSPPMVGNIPVEIINMNLQGIAEFMAYVRPDGEVARVEVLNGTGNEKLDAYIVPMILKSFWEPARKNGEPVGYTQKISVDFNTALLKFNFSFL